MSKALPVGLKRGSITKEIFEKRQNVENKLKGVNILSKTPPSHLCKQGKKIYKNIVSSMPKDIFNNTDEYVVSIVADSLARMQECQEIINREGLIVEYTNSAGATNYDQNKAVLIYQKYCEIFKKYIGEIGLSPSARSKLAIINMEQSQQDQDPLLKILGGGNDEY